MRDYAARVVAIFLILSAVFVLPELEVFHAPQYWIRTAAYGFCEKISGLNNFQSDGSGVYFSLLFAFVLSFFLGWIFSAHTTAIYNFAYRWCVFFLALILLKYGIMKLTFTQFYLPDSNILDTRLGNLSQDTVYWSLVGSSEKYQLFLGVAEVLTASLLLFRKTRFAGLLFSVALFANVVAVNFSFDISVKLLSLFCLVLTLLLLLFHLDSIGLIFQTRFRALRMPVSSATMLWVAALVVLLSENVLPRLSFETTSKIPHQGSYCLSRNAGKFYVHRSGYMILQESRELISYQLRSNSAALTTFLHKDHIDSVNWQEHLFSCPRLQVDEHFFPCKLNNRLLQRSFHWTSDEFH